MKRMIISALVLGSACLGANQPSHAMTPDTATPTQWTRDWDAPARHPYQEGQFPTGCSTYQGDCAILFATVPAGKTLVVTHVSCFISLQTGGTVIDALLGSQAFRNARDMLPVQAGGSAGLYGVNVMTNVYYNAGEQPRLDMFSTGAPFSASNNCTLSGYFYP